MNITSSTTPCSAVMLLGTCAFIRANQSVNGMCAFSAHASVKIAQCMRSMSFIVATGAKERGVRNMCAKKYFPRHLIVVDHVRMQAAIHAGIKKGSDV